MAYYNYHGKIKQRIKNNELNRYEIAEAFITPQKEVVKPCLLLYFDTSPMVRFIRPHKIDEYLELIK